jgi:hypothetical protein
MTRAYPDRQPALKGRARSTAAADARAIYEQGATVRSVAARIGRSYGSTYQLLVHAGTTFRDRHGRSRKAVG